jgi:hypothetical protein
MCIKKQAAYKANSRAWRRALAEVPVCCLSHAMNWVMVKVSGRLEPLPAPAEGAGAEEAAGLEGVAGAAEAAGLEGVAGAAEVATGAAELAGVAGLLAAAEEAAGLVGVAGEAPELAPSQTLGPGMV